MRVLVADDDPGVLGLLRLVLAGAGHQMLAAADGDAAWAALQSGAPEVAVLDVRMPGPTGLELLARIRADERVAGLPVILLSALTAEHEVLAGLYAGADCYLTKPFSPDELLRVLERATAGV